MDRARGVRCERDECVDGGRHLHPRAGPRRRLSGERPLWWSSLTVPSGSICVLAFGQAPDRGQTESKPDRAFSSEELGQTVLTPTRLTAAILTVLANVPNQSRLCGPSQL